MAGGFFGAAVKNSIIFMSRPRKAMSEWVVHCEVNQRHTRRSHPTKEAALKDACSQLVQGHAVNRIVGPNETPAISLNGTLCNISTVFGDQSGFAPENFTTFVHFSVSPAMNLPNSV